MLSCKDATHLMSEAQDQSLPIAKRLQLDMHLVMCQGCRNFKKQMSFIREACRSHPLKRNDPKP